MKLFTHQVIQLIIKVTALLVVISTIGYITLKYGTTITQLVGNPDQLKVFLASYEEISIVIFIGLQVLQVVIAAIPGELVQIAGGFVYGAVQGTFYSIIGITLGSILAFYISRVLGLSLLRTFISGKKFEKYSFLINSPKATIAIFILFLIPAIPKDIFSYIAGFTPVNPLLFFVLSSTARIPSLLVSCYIGANLQQGNYLTVVIAAFFVCLFLVVGLLIKDRAVTCLHNMIFKKQTEW